MKLIEALKQVKDLNRKADDLRGKIQVHSAHASYETPIYPNQKGQVSEWLQAHHDIAKEILRLSLAIQRTNLDTAVSIDIKGQGVEHSIAGWIHRRRTLASMEALAWKSLTDKGIREGALAGTQGTEGERVTVVRCYDPQVRDARIDEYQSEPALIDGRLEVVNAVTDLIET